VRLRELLRVHPAAFFGLVLGFVLVVIALGGPVLVRVDPNSIDVAARFSGPTAAHPLGTDDLGRDTLARLIYGSRMSLFIAVCAATLGTVIGQVVGLVSGFLGGWVDILVMRVVDLFFAIPTLLVAIGIVALFGASATTTILALGFAYAPFYARLIRGAVVGVRSRTYVDASRVLGSSGLRLLRADILPGVLPIALVQSTALLGYALVDEASLGFLGLGVQPPDASWGAMINAGRQFVFQAPWLTLIPGLAVIIAVFAINLTGDGLRDALDPRSSQRVTEQT
jgi:ABC-type dipeptide/oligopeptide/nickel transport system permease subunit